MDIVFDYVGTLKNSANNFVGAVYMASTGALVETHAVAKDGMGNYPIPPLSFELTFTMLTEGVGYIFRMWESTTTDPGGLQRTSYSFTGRRTVVTLRPDLQLTVGSITGPDDQAVTYTDASLVGWSFRINKISYGPLFYLQYWDRPTQDVIRLLDSLVFANGEEYNIEFMPQITYYDSPDSGLPVTSQIITANQTLTADDTNKYNFIQGASTYLEVLLPAGSTLVPFRPIYINSGGGTHKNVAVICQGSDSILRAKTTAYLVLGQNEDCVIFWDGTVFRVNGDLSAADNVGQIFYSYSQTEPKGIFGNGAVVSRKDYRRLWETALAAGMVVTLAVWNQSVTASDGAVTYPNKGFYHSGDTVNTFGLPLLSNSGFFRAVLTSAGTFNDWQLPDHQHVTTADDDVTATFGKTLVNIVRGVWGGNSSGKNALTSRPSDSNGNIFSRLGSELHSSYTRVYGLIRF